MGLEVSFARREGVELVGLGLVGAGVADGVLVDAAAWAGSAWILPSLASKKKIKRDGLTVTLPVFY